MRKLFYIVCVFLSFVTTAQSALDLEYVSGDPSDYIFFKVYDSTAVGGQRNARMKIGVFAEWLLRTQIQSDLDLDNNNITNVNLINGVSLADFIDKSGTPVADRVAFFIDANTVSTSSGFQYISSFNELDVGSISIQGNNEEIEATSSNLSLHAAGGFLVIIDDDLHVNEDIEVDGLIDGRNVAADGVALDNLDSALDFDGSTVLIPRLYSTITDSDMGAFRVSANLNVPDPVGGTQNFSLIEGYVFETNPTGWDGDRYILDLETESGDFFHVDFDGNLTFNGTADGRDVAADGAKLDLIEETVVSETQAGTRADGNPYQWSPAKVWKSIESSLDSMTQNNTETLINVTYNPVGIPRLNFVVDDDLSLYDNATSGFITDYSVTEGDVTAHEAALTVDHTQVSDFDTELAGTTNTTSFTPTADYHPATKKYVDDNGGGSVTFGSAYEVPYTNGSADDHDHHASFHFNTANSALNVSSLEPYSSTSGLILRNNSGTEIVSIGVGSSGSTSSTWAGNLSFALNNTIDFTAASYDFLISSSGFSTDLNSPSVSHYNFVNLPDIAHDTGTTPLSQWIFRETDGTYGAISTRPLWQITNFSTPILELKANGDWDYEGNNQTGIGSLFLDEKADADADVAGDGQIWVKNTTPNQLWFTDDAGTDLQLSKNEVYGFALSGTTGNLSTGTNIESFRMPFAATLVAVKIECGTAPTGSTIIVDVNESGTTVLSTKVSIDVSEKTSSTAATPPVISDSALADDAEITFDIDQIGSTVAGSRLKIWLTFRR